jgi:DNA helicase-2/ATP-dependent DNA helicase PcrA
MGSLFSRGFLNRVPDSEVAVIPAPPITLDSQQEAIVYSDKHHIVVVAGAGSGKTRVLTERVKFLIATGVQPSNIVAITFTNMAAEEMRDRLKDVEGIGDSFIGTIHSFANKVMQLSGENYSLYNDEIENRYHKYLIERYCHYLTFDKYLQYKDLLSDVELGKASDSELSNFFLPSEKSELSIIERNKKDGNDDPYVDYPETIRSLCERDNVITFDELLVKADHYFRSINAKVEHLLVDEFQDVGTLEFRFLDGLNAENHFFVGDDWQSIYGFKGGNVELFMKLVEDSDFSTYYLTNNYRNSSEILQVAQTVINQVSNKIQKNVVCKVKEPGEVSVSSRGKIYEHGINKIKDSGSYQNWFILTRTNKELFGVADKLARAGVPYITFKREGMSLADLNRSMATNRVKLLTVHTAKGLEADNVILYGKFPIVCPSYMCNEEERKVLYVGITRARKRLIILN